MNNVFPKPVAKSISKCRRRYRGNDVKGPAELMRLATNALPIIEAPRHG